MPAYGNPDMYSDAPAAPEKPEMEASESDEESPENEPTAEIPKSLFGGKEFKPGEEIVLEIVQLTENGAVVKYASEKGGEEYGGGEEEAPAPAPKGGEMASLME